MSRSRTSRTRQLLTANWYVPASLVMMAALGGAIVLNLAAQGNIAAVTHLLFRSQTSIKPPVAVPGSRLQAYILGSVRTPGVYSLATGARVYTLIQAAGGVTANADLTRVNVASLIADGQTVYIPAVGEVVPIEQSGKININLATALEMHDALGVSLTVANRIVAYRSSHGDFTAISQLLLVPVSRAIYDRIKDLVTI